MIKKIHTLAYKQKPKWNITYKIEAIFPNINKKLFFIKKFFFIQIKIILISYVFYLLFGIALNNGFKTIFGLSNTESLPNLIATNTTSILGPVIGISIGVVCSIGIVYGVTYVGSKAIVNFKKEFMDQNQTPQLNPLIEENKEKINEIFNEILILKDALLNPHNGINIKVTTTVNNLTKLIVAQGNKNKEISDKTDLIADIQKRVKRIDENVYKSNINNSNYTIKINKNLKNLETKLEEYKNLFSSQQSTNTNEFKKLISELNTCIHQLPDNLTSEYDVLKTNLTTLDTLLKKHATNLTETPSFKGTYAQLPKKQSEEEEQGWEETKMEIPNLQKPEDQFEIVQSPPQQPSILLSDEVKKFLAENTFKTDLEKTTTIIPQYDYSNQENALIIKSYSGFKKGFLKKDKSNSEEIGLMLKNQGFENQDKINIMFEMPNKILSIQKISEDSILGVVAKTALNNSGFFVATSSLLIKTIKEVIKQPEVINAPAESLTKTVLKNIIDNIS